MKHKALIIDGHNYLFRGFYGVPTQAKHSDGTQINAVYGFFSLLRKILHDLNPDYLLITFDTETSINNKILINPEYKANRNLENNTIYDQLLIIQKCLDILGIRWVSDARVEADDLIGSYSLKMNKNDMFVYIGSNDYDFMQLINDNITIARGYHGEITFYNKKEVYNKFGIWASQYLDFIAIKGDISDNITGIKGIGKVKAMQLLTEYGDIQGIYQSFDLLGQKIQGLLKGKQKFLEEQRDFLKILTKLPNHQFIDLECLIIENSPNKVPDKMGLFLREKWEVLSSSK